MSSNPLLDDEERKPLGQRLREMTANSEFAICPQCRNCALKVKPTKFDEVFISCVGFPNCKNSMQMPKGISELEMLNQKCSKCFNRCKREAFMFRLTFDREKVNEIMVEALPDNDNTSGIFCVFKGCDDNFEHLCINTKNVNLKRTYDQVNPNQNVKQGNYFNKDVPNYYYQKPENNDLIQNRVKPLQN